MTFSKIFDGLDAFICKYCNIDPERESEYYKIRGNAEDLKEILYDTEIIDGKSSALLTHISVMFVVLSIFLAGSDNHWAITLLLIIELIAYLGVSMVLLRCIDIMGPPFRQPPKEAQEVKYTYYFEVTLRREIYHRSVRTVYILTFFLIPIVIIKYAV